MYPELTAEAKSDLTQEFKIEVDPATNMGHYQLFLKLFNLQVKSTQAMFDRIAYKHAVQIEIENPLPLTEQASDDLIKTYGVVPQPAPYTRQSAYEDFIKNIVPNLLTSAKLFAEIKSLELHQMRMILEFDFNLQQAKICSSSSFETLIKLKESYNIEPKMAYSVGIREDFCFNEIILKLFEYRHICSFYAIRQVKENIQGLTPERLKELADSDLSNGLNLAINALTSEGKDELAITDALTSLSLMPKPRSSWAEPPLNSGEESLRPRPTQSDQSSFS